ncbi:hypothetical protein GCM10023317_13790 [Actinopolymorpha pittospori]
MGRCSSVGGWLGGWLGGCWPGGWVGGGTGSMGGIGGGGVGCGDVGGCADPPIGPFGPELAACGSDGITLAPLAGTDMALHTSGCPAPFAPAPPGRDDLFVPVRPEPTFVPPFRSDGTSAPAQRTDGRAPMVRRVPKGRPPDQGAIRQGGTR